MKWNEPASLDQEQFDPAEVFAAGQQLHAIANTAYPIGHISTMRYYRVPYNLVKSTATAAWTDSDSLGLYVHIPFCEQRCSFCEYTVVDPAVRQDSENPYFEALLQEFRLYDEAIGTQAKKLIGFDIGGGTPSAASIQNIQRVVQAAHQHFQLPDEVTISIETTPRIAALEAEKIRSYYELGIRRISMGIQSINPQLLKAVGRTATSVAYNLQAAENIRTAGFKRFNVDIMYGFAHQSMEGLAATLEHAIHLGPEYITLYRTRYKGTRLADQAFDVSMAEINQQTRLMKSMLQAGGYHGTAGKNTFSRLAGDPGTSDYLTERVIHGTPYLGLGLGAQSLSETSLAYNNGAADKQIRLYAQKISRGQLPIQDLYHLSPAAAMGKMVSVSFYFGEINLDSFERKFSLKLEKAFPAEISFVLDQGLMEIVRSQEYGSPARTLRLTEQGEMQYNGVIALFYAGAVKAYLLEMAKSRQTSQTRRELIPE